MRLYHVHVSTKFEANRSKNTATVAQNAPKWTFLRHYVATSLRHDLFFHMIRLTYLSHNNVYAQFEANRSKNTATMAKKPPILTFLRHNVVTSLRHDVKFHMLQCAYTMPMCVPNLKQIGRKTRPQWPKNHLNGRFYVKTSRRSYVMTLFFTCYDAPILCPCVY